MNFHQLFIKLIRKMSIKIWNTRIFCHYEWNKVCPYLSKTRNLWQMYHGCGHHNEDSDTFSFWGYWSTHTKPSHTRVNSPHFWSTHPIYKIKKDYSEGVGLWYLAPIVGQSI